MSHYRPYNPLIDAPHETTGSALIDEVVHKVFLQADQYYPYAQMQAIGDILIKYLDKGLIEELQRLAAEKASG